MLQVAHVPMVYLVKEGELVDSFSGIQENAFITDFIEKGLKWWLFQLKLLPIIIHSW